ncbi:MAG: mechanosensitive ion channel [Candidatus Nanohaloarchaeota archaeon QJJ-5]|nr:mechanosensitive ion channel [Candidatus Nanohaloarchaeota archaeon QJJ-5]
MDFTSQPMSEFLNIVLEQPTPVRILVTFGILAGGFLLGRIASTIFKYFYQRRASEDVVEKIRNRDKQPHKPIEYIFTIATIGLALLYLNAPASSDLYRTVIENAPIVMTAILTVILGIFVINLSVNFMMRFIDTVGLKKYFQELGFSPKIMELSFKGLKVLLYLVIIDIALVQLGIQSQILSNAVIAASYGMIGVIGLLAFFGFKDLIRNYAAGLYLRSSDVLKPGKKVKFEDETGEIRDISAFGTTISTDSGYFMLTPNSELMDRKVLFKRVQADIETLEDIKKYFVAQEPSYCGPASAEMALTLFGYDIDQGRLAEVTGTEVGKGVMPDDLIEGIENETDGEIRAAWVEYDNITDLGDEFKTWFNDGGLVVPNFAKPMLFPQANTGHYVLSVGVEGDELLIVDPSAHTTSGGVYYVDKDEMLDAMQEWEDRKRGYIIMAPEGTTAYWRIKEGLIYADKNYYDSLSKTLEVRLRKIMRKGRILKSVMPDSVEDFLDQWRREEKVDRVWKPDQKNDTGEKQLDEFTDTDE